MELHAPEILHMLQHKAHVIRRLNLSPGAICVDPHVTEQAYALHIK